MQKNDYTYRLLAPTRHLRYFFPVAVLTLYFAIGSKAQCPANSIVIELNSAGTGSWTAPSTGGPYLIQVLATGAGGGNGENNSEGGSGATATGTFIFQNGETIFAICGGQGLSSTDFAGGGGGATGAVNCGNPSNCAAGTILILAAGGNGGENQGNGLGGSSLTNGNGNGGAGGGGNGGGGGGGVNFGGADGTGADLGEGGGVVFKNALSAGGDGAGAVGDPDGGSGMGGGGGGGGGNNSGSGGGAGHTGAPGGNGASATSFNSGDDQANADGLEGQGPSEGSITVICLGVLPIHLTDFKALIQNDGSVRLLWNTATEKNNHGYDIEHSTDNRHWKALGFVPGNGTTSIPQEYTFTHEIPLSGVNYYRLKQLDFDGKFEYSPMVVADIRASELQFDIFPNPSTTGELSVRTVSGLSGSAILEMYDWMGFKVYKETVQVLEGTVIHPVSMVTFPKGAYTARLEMPDGQVYFRKILLQ
ncbi:MAG: hypothetical protein IPJ82_18235 [Lewinellaceae bacterium]|nr:hypothetical protein [Lewinellaceae bacterium]